MSRNSLAPAPEARYPCHEIYTYRGFIRAIESGEAYSKKSIRIAEWNDSHEGVILIQNMPFLERLSIRGYDNDIVISGDCTSLQHIAIEKSTKTVTINVPCKSLSLYYFNGKVIFDHDSLKSITMYTSNVEEINFVKHQSELGDFSVINSIICDKSFIDSIPKMNHLRELRLEHINIESLPNLSGLSKLRILEISNTSISDLSFLKGLSLEYLGITALPINSLAILEGMEIETLIANEILADNYEVIRTLRGLKNLSLCENGIGSISFLQGLGLEKLYLFDNSIIDLGPLSSCLSLMHLKIQNNLVYDVTPLYKCPKLRTLDIQNNYVFHVEKKAMNLEKCLTNNNYFSRNPFDGIEQETYKDMREIPDMSVDDGQIYRSLNNVLVSIKKEIPVTATLEECRNLFSIEDRRIFSNILANAQINERASMFGDILERLCPLIEKHKDKELFMSILCEDIRESCMHGKALQLAALYCSFFDVPVNLNTRTLMLANIIRNVYVEGSYVDSAQMLLLVKDRVNAYLAE